MTKEIKVKGVCWRVGDFAEHITEENVIVKITEVSEMSWFKCFVVSDCSYIKNMVYCFSFGDFRKLKNKVDDDNKSYGGFVMNKEMMLYERLRQNVDGLYCSLLRNQVHHLLRIEKEWEKENDDISMRKHGYVALLERLDQIEYSLFAIDRILKDEQTLKDEQALSS